jgi:hypothetical protein
MRQHPGRQNTFELPGGAALWKAAGVGLLVLLPLVLCCHFVLRSLATGIEEKIGATDLQYYDLMITNSLLKAERSGLMTPEKAGLLAGRKIALQKPEKGQVLVYNRASGQFRYL